MRRIGRSHVIIARWLAASDSGVQDQQRCSPSARATVSGHCCHLDALGRKRYAFNRARLHRPILLHQIAYVSIATAFLRAIHSISKHVGVEVEVVRVTTPHAPLRRSYTFHALLSPSRTTNRIARQYFDWHWYVKLLAVNIRALTYFAEPCL
jgi:hypothetical protein